MKPLTPLMTDVMRALAAEYPRPMIPNHIAIKIGFSRGQDRGKHSHNGRAMAPANRVIHPLVALRARGLVTMASRPDRLSGTAYALTEAGVAWRDADEILGLGRSSEERRDARRRDAEQIVPLRDKYRATKVTK